jgi:GTPase SAR1 family protein
LAFPPFFIATPPPSIMLLGDVGGQRTLRPYWRNYFEQTDALVWVVDSSDRMRMQDCKRELHSLLTEDVRENVYFLFNFYELRPVSAISRGVFACVCQ